MLLDVWKVRQIANAHGEMENGLDAAGNVAFKKEEHGNRLFNSITLLTVGRLNSYKAWHRLYVLVNGHQFSNEATG